MNNSTDGYWLPPDPLAGDVSNPQSLNRYAYVLNNPTTLTDPLGLGDCGGDLNFPCNGPPGEPPPPPGHEGTAGGGFGAGASTDWFDYCSYASSNDASCANYAGLWDNGRPIYGAPDVGGFGWSSFGGGGVWSEAAPPFGGAGGFGLPCDFGSCGPWSPSGNGFMPGAVATWPLTVIKITAWGTIATGALAVADAALLGYDVYQGYRLAQAYGYFLPKPVPVSMSHSKTTTMHSDHPECDAQYEQDADICRKRRTSACWASAMERWVQCCRGGYLPPLAQ
jgi:hypothetical protein